MKMPPCKKLILSIKGDVEGGSSLAEALAKQPLYFDDLFVNLVESGEQAGALESLLDKIATYKEKTEAIKKKIKKALTYPAAVLVVAFVVTTILLIFVIPSFEDLFKGFGADLPAFTRMIIDLSAFVRTKGCIYLDDYWWFRCDVFVFQEALQAFSSFSGSHDAQVADHWTYSPESLYRAILTYIGDHVCRRCAVS